MNPERVQNGNRWRSPPDTSLTIKPFVFFVYIEWHLRHVAHKWTCSFISRWINWCGIDRISPTRAYNYRTEIVRSLFHLCDPATWPLCIPPSTNHNRADAIFTWERLMVVPVNNHLFFMSTGEMNEWLNAFLVPVNVWGAGLHNMNGTFNQLTSREISLCNVTLEELGHDWLLFIV